MLLYFLNFLIKFVSFIIKFWIAGQNKEYINAFQFDSSISWEVIRNNVPTSKWNCTKILQDKNSKVIRDV